MSDTAAVATTPSVPKQKKGAKAAGAKKPKAASNHPKTAEMVIAAIANLKDRGGSSSQAIKKYIANEYKVDVERLAPFLKKYLKSAVVSGKLVQTKGKGASGSFKIAKDTKDKPKVVKKANPTPKKKVTAAKKETASSDAKPKTKAVKKSPKKVAPKKTKAAKPKKAGKVEKKAKSPKAPIKSPKKAKTTKPKPAAKKTTKKAPAAKKSPKKA